MGYAARSPSPNLHQKTDSKVTKWWNTVCVPTFLTLPSAMACYPHSKSLISIKNPLLSKASGDVSAQLRRRHLLAEAIVTWFPTRRAVKKLLLYWACFFLLKHSLSSVRFYNWSFGLVPLLNSSFSSCLILSRAVNANCIGNRVSHGLFWQLRKQPVF